MILVVGLGNPGKKFKETRHNVGFSVVNEFSRENDFPGWKESKNNNCLYAKKEIAGEEVELIKSLNFMNSSGLIIKSISKKHNLKPENIFVVHDDIDLDLGKIKIVKNRGAAGHKGVQSVIDEILSKNFVRFRIGIQPETGKPKNVERFVLQKFNKQEEEKLKEVIKKSYLIIEATIKEGVERAMQEYNK